MMDPILQAAWDGFAVVFSWPNILYPVLGTVLAMGVAMMPGVSGLTLMALTIPFTLSWEPVPIMLLFGALLGGATFMGSVTAILVNIPGKASNAATVLDGHALARMGHAKTAIACSALSSALGSSFGILVLIILIPFFGDVVLSVGPPEFLVLIIWGMVTLAFASRGSFIKSLAMVGLGFLLSTVGLDPRTAEARFTFGSLYLQDGIGMIPFFLGVFAIAETIFLAASGRRTISGKEQIEELGGSLIEGMLAVFRNFGLFLRSSVIGTIVGMIPGIGGTVASFVAYGHAMQTASQPSRFGEGDIRGVLASEAANDAKDAGALVPTLAFGIPGGGGTALLLVALTLHGMVPGKELLTSDLSLVFVLVWSLFLSNWLTSLIGVAMVNPLVRVTVLPTQALVPFMLVLSLLGAYLNQGEFADILTAVTFGIFGYFCKRENWPRIPLVIAFVLGPHLERYFHITASLYSLDRISFLNRPILLVLLGLFLASLLLAAYGGRERRKERP